MILLAMTFLWAPLPRVEFLIITHVASQWPATAATKSMDYSNLKRKQLINHYRMRNVYLFLSLVFDIILPGPFFGSVPVPCDVMTVDIDGLFNMHTIIRLLLLVCLSYIILLMPAHRVACVWQKSWGIERAFPCSNVTWLPQTINSRCWKTKSQSICPPKPKCSKRIWPRKSLPHEARLCPPQTLNLLKS